MRGKLDREELTAGVDSLMAAAGVLRKKRATASHFGNGGEVANLLSEAKLRKEGRRTDGSRASRQVKCTCDQSYSQAQGSREAREAREARYHWNRRYGV